MKKISILGSTGSIGTQTLETVDHLKNIEVTAITANSNITLLEQQIRKYKPQIAAVADSKLAAELKIKVADTPTKVYGGEEGITTAATCKNTDMTIAAIVGIAGLKPTMEAVGAGIDVGLANKETLVTGGSLFTRAVKENGIKLMPVDSEHCAIFQCLQCGDTKEVHKIIITASGGPFRGFSKEKLKTVTREQALKHPNWSMGAKITIDSASLMNKGLEVIEAHWLFNMPYEKIEVVVHPQSIIHSMVEFCDHAVIAQMGTPDMRLPIQYAITYPERQPMEGNVLDFKKYSNLTFEEPDYDAFPCLGLAYEAGAAGGILPAVLNGANEAAVELFLKGKIEFIQIPQLIEKAIGHFDNIETPALEDILTADILTREYVKGLVI